MIKQTFAERCQIAEQCLPDAPYRAMLTNLHAEMLAALAEQPAQQERNASERLEPVAYAEQSVLDWLASDKRGPTAYAKTTLAKRKDDKAQAPLYTSPPASKPWVGLTDDEQDECVDIADEAHINKPLIFWSEHHYNAIEAKLKEKNA